jgi:prevent-host-death family protein
MPVAPRIRNPREELAGPPQVSSSAAKNGFGRMLDRVAREGPLAITKHREPCAVLISIEEYRALIGAEKVVLNTLAEEFDALFDRMQQPGAAEAMKRAFAMSPEQLGRAAVKEAALKPAQRRRATAKFPALAPVPTARASAKPPALPPVPTAGVSAKATAPNPARRGRAAGAGARRARG